jgi:hypothetical protein
VVPGDRVGDGACGQDVSGMDDTFLMDFVPNNSKRTLMGYLYGKILYF